MKRGKLLLWVLGITLATAGGWLSVARAADVPSDFNLQVTPSPLVTTVKPGVQTTVELKIRNGSSGTEKLKIEPRSFTFNSETGEVDLDDTTSPTIASWVSFSAPQFTAAPGQWVTERVTFNVPADAGFSYSFALIVNRQEDPSPVEGARLIKGAVAVFTLINVDRPGATSSLEVVEFKSSKGIYEYLPAEFSVSFNNTGNTITQPYGNIFIERGGEGAEPLATLPVNSAKAYILPETTRAITANWGDGFPAYKTVQNADGTTSQKLVWDWTKVSSLRIGRYTAKLVAVYNQGGRDVPIEGTVSFWVLPWKILGVLLLIVLLILFALFMLVRMIVKSIRRRHGKHSGQKSENKD